MLLGLQEHGAGTAGAVAHRFGFIQAQRRQRGAEFGRPGRGKELAALLAGTGLEEADQDHVGRAQNVKLLILQIHVDLADFGNDLADLLGALGDRIPEAGILEPHVIEQALEGLFRFMAESGAGQRVDRTLIILDRKPVGIAIRPDNPPVQLAEQVLRANDVPQVLQRPLLHDRLEVRIGEGLLIGQAIVLQDLFHVHLGALGEIAVEYRPEDIVPELIGIHAAAQIIRNRPQPGGKVRSLLLKLIRIDGHP